MRFFKTKRFKLSDEHSTYLDLSNMNLLHSSIEHDSGNNVRLIIKYAVQESTSEKTLILIYKSDLKQCKEDQKILFAFN